MIILFLTAMLCLSTFTSAFASGADAQGYYRADYTIPAGKKGYAPSSIYATRNGFSRNYYAMYDLEECDYSDSSLNTVLVHIWNRKLGKQVTGRNMATCGPILELMYLNVPDSTHQCKPVTYKSNADHYNESVKIFARFLP